MKNASDVLGRRRYEVEALFGDGSDRKFYRLRNGPASFVALISPRRAHDGTDENDSYFLIGNHLRRIGIPVPEIVWADGTQGFFLLEDLGDRHLQKNARRSVSDLESLYRRALLLLIRLHRLAPVGFESRFCFDSDLYSPSFVFERELEYFRRAFLVGYLGVDIGPEDLRADFENLAEAAGVDKSRLVIHRDFQSRNIMVRKGRLRLIDFQGMRYGPPVYDLASLLVDPYVSLPKRLQEKLVAMYWTAASGFLGGGRTEFMRSYARVRLCRNLQALGAYGHLVRVKGKSHFRRYVPVALQRLSELLDGPSGNDYPKLRKVVGDVTGRRRVPVRRWSLP